MPDKSASPQDITVEQLREGSRFDSIEQLRRGLRRYIHYSIHLRIVSKLKDLSPVHYRTQALAA